MLHTDRRTEGGTDGQIDRKGKKAQIKYMKIKQNYDNWNCS